MSDNIFTETGNFVKDAGNEEPCVSDFFGMKFDEGSSPIFQGLFDYFPRALAEVARLSGLGAQKYEWKGWETVPDAQVRYRNALGRHIIKRATEGEYDTAWLRSHKQEVLHDVAVAWNALAVAEMRLREIEDENQQDPY
jgi:hypothetical protein